MRINVNLCAHPSEGERLPTLTKPRKKKDVTIRLDLYQWIEKGIERGKFWNFSHAIEIALDKLKDTEEAEEKS
jgi:hypothetical protein